MPDLIHFCAEAYRICQNDAEIIIAALRLISRRLEQKTGFRGKHGIGARTNGQQPGCIIERIFFLHQIDRQHCNRLMIHDGNFISLRIAAGTTGAPARSRNRSKRQTKRTRQYFSRHQRNGKTHHHYGK